MQKRLSKFLAAAGVAARRKAEELIFAGKVCVNGVVTLLPQTLVGEGDAVECEGKRVVAPERRVYFLLNKPAGLLCSAEGSRSVLSLFSHLPYRLFTAGRLDQETTGLLIVTNDGIFANRVIHPSFNHSKEYLAKTFEEVGDEHLRALSQGAFVEGTFVKPLRVSKVRRGTVKVVVGEGKKREVRRLFERAGLTLLSLARIRIGPLVLGNLAPGDFRALTAAEIAFFE